jgi:hypothetical protein
MPPPLTRRYLDSKPCSDLNCTHRHENIPRSIKPHCHEKAGTTVRYREEDWVLVFCCHKCGQLVVEVAVAVGAVKPGVTKLRACHDRGIRAWYLDGYLTLQCRWCKRAIQRIEVASDGGDEGLGHVPLWKH